MLLAAVMVGSEVGVSEGRGAEVFVGRDVGELINAGEAVGSSGVCVD
jgi:hypothetical protein